MKYKKDNNRLIWHLLSMPFIYSVTIPLVIFDIWLEVYHRICFTAYGLPYVKRSQYIRIDRQKLKYLNIIEKLNCMYCGYANGLLHYSSIIAGETEKYWCGIKHKKDNGFIEPAHHNEFIEYGDEEAFRSIQLLNMLYGIKTEGF